MTVAQSFLNGAAFMAGWATVWCAMRGVIWWLERRK